MPIRPINTNCALSHYIFRCKGLGGPRLHLQQSRHKCKIQLQKMSLKAHSQHWVSLLLNWTVPQMAPYVTCTGHTGHILSILVLNVAQPIRFQDLFLKVLMHSETVLTTSGSWLGVSFGQQWWGDILLTREEVSILFSWPENTSKHWHSHKHKLEVELLHNLHRDD